VTKIVLVAQRARCKVDLGVCSAYCHKAACPGCFRKTNREKEEEKQRDAEESESGKKNGRTRRRRCEPVWPSG